MGKSYFKSDGNGGYEIGKYTLTLLGIFISVLFASVGFASSAAYSQAQIGTQVDNAVLDISDLKKDIKDLSEKANSDHEKIEHRLDTIEKNLVLNNQLIDSTDLRCTKLEDHVYGI